jgi:hypothetical protein
MGNIKRRSQLRRIVVVATALAVLMAAASAFAAAGGINSYTATLKFSPNKANTALGFTQKYVAGGTGGNRTAPLTNIKTVIYGMTSDGKDFPTCSAAKISANGDDTVCPKGALVATGSITAILGPANDRSASAPSQLPCNPLLDVWNAGSGKVVYFFVDKAPAHTCAGGAIQTGGVAPFIGTIKIVGKNLVMNTPIPTYVSFPLTGIEGSLTSETLTWKNLSSGTHHYGASVACKSGSRPYSVTFTAEAGPGGAPSQTTVNGAQKCS